MEKEIKNLEPCDSNIGVDPYWEVRREAFRNGYDAAESDYWKKFRREAAKDFMCTFITTDKGRRSFAEVRCEDNADTAIMYADALIRKLLEGENDWLNNQLKSLRPSWKPSEEQMETLLGAKGVLRNLQYNDWAKILASLYEQLKKL